MVGCVSIKYAGHLLHIREAAASQVGQIDGGGFGWTQDADSSDNTQRTLPSNEQLLEVVAGVVLAQRLQQIQDCACGCHCFDAQHRAPKRPEPQEAQAACMTQTQDWQMEALLLDPTKMLAIL